MNAPDPERIWLQAAVDADPHEGRQWCQDKVWPDNDEDSEPVEYVRADLFAALTAERDAAVAEVARLTRYVAANEAMWKADHKIAQDAIAAGAHLQKDSQDLQKAGAHNPPIITGQSMHSFTWEPQPSPKSETLIDTGNGPFPINGGPFDASQPVILFGNEGFQGNRHERRAWLAKMRKANRAATPPQE
jgi:hypothetical protein